MAAEVHRQRDYSYRLTQWLNWFDKKPHGEALFVICMGTEIIGFALSKPNSDPAIAVPGEFHACYILPEFRGGSAGPIAMMALALSLYENGLWPACIWAFSQNPYRRVYPALGCKSVVFRDRQIAGHSIPEIGYRVDDYNQLMARLDRMRVSSALPKTRSPQKLLRRSQSVG